MDNIEFLPDPMLAVWGHRSVPVGSLLITNKTKSMNALFSCWSMKGRIDLCWSSGLLCVAAAVFDPGAVKHSFPSYWAGSFCVQPDSQECFLHGSSPLQSLLSKTMLAGEIILRLQVRVAVWEHLLTTATSVKEGLSFSQWASQPVISTLQCGVGKGKVLQAQHARNTKGSSIRGQARVPKWGLAHKKSKGWLLLECCGESLSGFTSSRCSQTSSLS